MTSGSNGGRVGLWTRLACAALALSATAWAAKHPNSAIAEKYGSLPLHFEENKGQADSSVRYLSRGSGYSLMLTPSQAVLSLAPKDGSALVRMNFAGSSGAAAMRAEAPLPGVSNYFIGADRSRWIAGSKHFGKVVYQQLYPGVDAVFYGSQRQLEYDFVVAPGINPDVVRLSFDGIKSLRLDSDGSLVLTTPAGDIRQKAPVVYQEIGGKRRLVRGRYMLHGEQVGFAIAKYDRRKPLVIDPVLLYSSVLGGTADEEARGIAIDASRRPVIVGRTASTDFGLIQLGLARGGGDAFMIKLGVNGTSVVHATYFGGVDNDGATSVAIDAQGNALVAGYTDSGSPVDGFPTTGNYQTIIGGKRDAFLTKFAADSNVITYSTFLGGLEADEATSVAVDMVTGAAYVGGFTSSPNFSLLKEVQSSLRGTQDGFAVKFTSQGVLDFSTYLGDSGVDAVRAIAVDPAGAPYVTGETNSRVFPTLSAFQPTLANCPFNVAVCPTFDAFVTKLSVNGAPLVYSTFLGGSGNEQGNGIAVDAAGSAYVTGFTDSNNLPVLGAFQSAYAGQTDAFIAKIGPTGAARTYLSYIGGAGEDVGRAVRLDPTGAAVVVGSTTSTDFPVNNFLTGTNNGAADAFVVVVNPAGSARTLSTYLGGVASDYANAVAVDTTGNAYVAGQTFSTNYPTLNPLQSSFNGASEAFVTKISNCTLNINPTSITVGSGQANTVVTITGASDCPWSVSTSDNWITFSTPTSGTGPGLLGVNIGANSGVPRVGVISIAGQIFTVTQEGSPIAGCVYPPNPQNVIVLPEGLSATFLIQTSVANCQWTTTSDAPWLQPFPLSGTGPANIQYTVFPNFSTLVRVGRVYVNGQAFTVSQAGSGLNANQRFVALAYFNFLGRYPSQSEIDFQAGQLASGVARADLVMSFYSSSEFNTGGRFAAGLYYGLLNRDPEFGGWLFQRNALARGGVTQFQLVANFLGSGEFALRYGSPNDAEFIRILYRNILGREAGNDEVNFHVATLPVIGRTQAAVNFLNSNEFRTRIDARLTAFLLYATLLGRDATANELLTRQTQISLGTPVRTLVDQFIASAEFLIQII